MIDTKALRQKILDMAIKGKLVPQDPNDEPASVLLERIRAEKQQLIKEGKIKKDKNDSVIFKGDDNRYYENLPYGWKICSVSDIAYLRTGATFDKANVLLSNKNEGIRVLRGGNISTYKIDFQIDDIFIPTAIVNPSIHVQQYDIITPAVTSLENIGKMARVFTKPTSNYTVGGFVYLLTPLFYNDTFSKFLLYQFTSTWFIRQLQAIAKKSGAAFYNINKTKFNGLPVFIPPLEEQARIVKRIEELFEQIEIIEQNQADIDTLYEEFRKRTLTLAIQGKLVPQDPNDEPACVLLERIRAKKKAKLGKKFVDSYIYKGDDNCYYEKIKDSLKEISDEIPFDVPESWQWIRIDNLFQHNTGKALNSSNTKGILHPYITTSNVYWGHCSLDRVKEMYFTEDEFEKCSIVPGDLLVCEGGDVGRAAIWNENISMCIQNHIHRLRAYYPVCTAFYYFAFFVYKSIGLIGGKGIGIQGLSSGALGKLIFPLPPLAEQERIVKRVEIILEKLKDED